MAALGEMLLAVSQQHHYKMAFWEAGNHFNRHLDKICRNFYRN